MRRLVAFVAVLAGVATLAVAITPQPSGAGGNVTPWAALLARIPDTAANRSQVVMNDYDAAREALGLPAPTGTPQERVRALSRLATEAGLAPNQLLRNGTAALDDELGFSPTAIGRDAEAGAPPRVLTVLEGDFDRSLIQRAAEADDTWSDAFTAKLHSGTEYFAWDGEKPNVRKVTPVRPLGIGGRLFVDRPFLAWSYRTAPMLAAIETAAGDRPSLADADDFTELDTAMTDQGAFATFMSDVPVLSSSATTTLAPAPPTTTLEPYNAFATGATRDGDTPVMIVAIVHDDAATAHENAGRLRSIIEQGTAANGAPWSELVDSSEVSDEGSVVVARLHVRNPQLWYQVVLRRDSLLAAG
jgi:hypothetical protein